MAAEERFQIQRCNWQVVNCSTPANYYHVLRRQLHREFRKPLIIATPKNLLRERKCTSTLEEMGTGTRFLRTIGESNEKVLAAPEKVRKLIMCSGKIWYELEDERTKRGITDVAIIRIEQLAPFPWDHVADECARYKNATVTWVQEEPKNMGPWAFVQPRIATATRTLNNHEVRPSYVGRKPSAATATGLGGRAHTAEVQAIMDEAMA